MLRCTGFSQNYSSSPELGFRLFLGGGEPQQISIQKLHLGRKRLRVTPISPINVMGSFCTFPPEDGYLGFKFTLEHVAPQEDSGVRFALN